MNRTRFVMASVATLALGARCFAVEPSECRALRQHGHRTEARACFTALGESNDAFTRAEGYSGLDQYEEANEQFRIAHKEGKNSPAVRVEWGRLFLERFNPAEAANLFQEALKIDANYAPAYLGFGAGSCQGIRQEGCRFCPRCTSAQSTGAAHELLSYLALEDSDPKSATEEAQRALTLSPEALDGLAVLASVDWLNNKPNSEWMDRILKVNPVYGQRMRQVRTFW